MEYSSGGRTSAQSYTVPEKTERENGIEKRNPKQQVDPRPLRICPRGRSSTNDGTKNFVDPRLLLSYAGDGMHAWYSIILYNDRLLPLSLAACAYALVNDRERERARRDGGGWILWIYDDVLKRYIPGGKEAVQRRNENERPAQHYVRWVSRLPPVQHPIGCNSLIKNIYIVNCFRRPSPCGARTLP